MTLNLVVLRSADINRTTAFYSAVLGLEFEQHADHGPLHYGAQVGPVYMEIYPTKKQQIQLDSVGFQVTGLQHIVDNNEEAVYHKVEVREGKRRVTLKDPDGRLVFLTEQL